jgi:hypothetical protein
MMPTPQRPNQTKEGDRMTPEQALEAFHYGLSLLKVDDQGLQYDQCDPTDLQAVGGASVLMHRMASKAESPVDCALSRLCITTGALLVAPRGDVGARIAREWLDAKAEYTALQIAAQS